MHVQRLLSEGSDASELQRFYETLLVVGEDAASTQTFCIPESMCAPTEHPCNLIGRIFGKLNLDPSTVTASHLTSHALLTPCNEDVNQLNNMVMALFPGDERVYYSADSMEDEDEAAMYPIEFMSSLQPAGSPSYELCPKVGAPIMLLRNKNAALGHANGTRLIVQSMLANVLQAEIVTGRHAGNSVLVPRITIEPSDERIPFTFRRHQFPVRPAFAMTINKWAAVCCYVTGKRAKWGHNLDTGGP